MKTNLERIEIYFPNPPKPTLFWETELWNNRPADGFQPDTMFVLRCCGRVKVGADSCLVCRHRCLYSFTAKPERTGVKGRNNVAATQWERYIWFDSGIQRQIGMPDYSIWLTVYIYFCSFSPLFLLSLFAYCWFVCEYLCAACLFGSLKTVYKFTLIVIIVSFLRQSNMQKYGHQRYLIFETNKTVKQKRHYVCSL